MVVLMRPKAPKNGKRIFMERITFLWKRFNFSQKVTIRNIFRYKKRALITIIGIAGCTGLMLAGFGIRDSVIDIPNLQFGEVFKYDTSITLSNTDGLKQINEYERGVKFTAGKFTKIMLPGWRIVLPIFQSYKKVDIRTKVDDVPEQEAITKDNVSVKINAVIYYKVFDASLAVLQVEDFYYATAQLAQTTMRNIVGSVTLDELLCEREKVSSQIKEIIDKETDPWGIKVENVELKDISLTDEMKRVIARAAEAEREKQAVITKSIGEKEAAENLADAARKLAESPGALHLRTLETINDVSSDQSNTIFFPIPMDVLEAVKGYSEKLKKENKK